MSKLTLSLLHPHPLPSMPQPAAARSSSLNLPEITDIIASYLTPPILLHCILVNKRWNTLFLPHLYSSISDNLYSWQRTFLRPPSSDNEPYRVRVPRLRQKQPREWERVEELLAHFTKYGHLIRHLTMTLNIAHGAAAASRACRGLVTLTSKMLGPGVGGLEMEREHDVLWYPESAFRSSFPEEKALITRMRTWHERTWIASQWFWHLVRQNTATLQVLEDSKMLFFSKNAQEEETVLLSKRILDEAVELLGSCPRLTKLMVDCSDLELQDVVQKIPQLRHFISRNTHWMPFKLMLDTPAPTSSQLRTVYIAEGVSRGIILSLLTYLPNLERLSVGTRYEEYSQPGGPHMPKSSIPLSLKSRLKGLHFTRRTSNISEHHLLIADILPFVPDLVEIGFPYLDPEIATALAVYCPNLQRFHQTRRPKSIRRGAFTSGVRNSLGILLSSCPNLQEFDGVGHEIEADYLIANPWICRNLQVLRCQIIGLTRLSEKEEINYNQGILFRYRLGYPLSKKESLAVDKHMLEIRPQHTKVYAKLATLVNLRILELGTEYRDLALNTYKTVPSIQRGTEWFIDYGSPAPDTLELSLESGLAQLSTLTKLEVFGLEGVDYRIDEEELRWMAKAWPRLKVISGLQEVEELMRLPHDGEKWYRRVYMQMLRPDVRHERRRVVEPF